MSVVFCCCCCNDLHFIFDDDDDGETYFGLASLVIRLNENLANDGVLVHLAQRRLQTLARSQYGHAAHLFIQQSPTTHRRMSPQRRRLSNKKADEVCVCVSVAECHLPLRSRAVCLRTVARWSSAPPHPKKMIFFVNYKFQCDLDKIVK